MFPHPRTAVQEGHTDQKVLLVPELPPRIQGATSCLAPFCFHA